MDRTPYRSPAQAPAPAPAPAKAASQWPMFAGLFWDVGLSLVAYYGLRALGASPYVALLGGTVTAGLRIAYVWARTRRFDGFAAFMLVEFGVGLGFALMTGDARFLVAKESFSTAVAGLVFLGTCAIGRPIAQVPRKTRPATAVLNDSFATRNRASPVISANPRPTPNSTSMNAAKPSKRRVRAHTYAMRRPAVTVPPSRATYGDAPRARRP